MYIFIYITTSLQLIFFSIVCGIILTKICSRQSSFFIGYVTYIRRDGVQNNPTFREHVPKQIFFLLPNSFFFPFRTVRFRPSLNRFICNMISRKKIWKKYVLCSLPSIFPKKGNEDNTMEKDIQFFFLYTFL